MFLQPKRIQKPGLFSLFFVLATVSSAMGQTALPYPRAGTPKATDLGALNDVEGTKPMSVTIALHLRDLNEAESLMKSLYTPGDPQFHKFLTSEQFAARFAPTNEHVAKIVAGLAKYGLTAERATATTLKVTGLPADMERAFTVRLHSYEVPAHDNLPGYTYHAPLTHPTIPSEISAWVAAIVGLDSRPSLRPLQDVAPQTLGNLWSTVPSTKTGNAFGHLTVTDFANLYDVNPLYSKGVTGAGRTLGIITFASFTPSDAFAYWSALGLSVNANRIQTVNIDGGPGAPSDASGSLETTLDVEQSGGIAPGANIIVYQAPGTNQGQVDVFAAAVDANSADTLSDCWGTWEWYQNLENSPVIDPITGQTVGITQATHELLVRGAIQGQTFFAAAGDGGAYDVTGDLGCYGPYTPAAAYSCSQPLSVDYPASDTAITAAGGTTLPGIQEYCINATCTPPYVIDIPHERVWGWDYLEGWCAAIGAPNLINCGIFPSGGGGGVSVLFEEPSYQIGIPGIQLSQPRQIYEVGEGIASEDEVPLFYALPSYYPGRNVPDVSFNADPKTGYVVYYTSEPSGVFVEVPGVGGTSFVAPQLNGVSALYGEYLQGSRLGLLNYLLYDLTRTGQAYVGPNAPLHAIAYGDNWFYYGGNGYNPAAGLGTLDVGNFAEFLRNQQ